MTILSTSDYMPNYTRKYNIVSKYLGKDIGKMMEDGRFFFGAIGAGVITSQLINRYSNNEEISKLAGLGVTATAGPLPALVYLVSFYPSLLQKIRGKF
jgi:hypothetical protein